MANACFCCPIQFRLYSVFELLSECHEWSAAPISAYLRRGPLGYFRGEFICTGGESIATTLVKLFLAFMTHQRRARGWTGRE